MAGAFEAQRWLDIGKELRMANRIDVVEIYLNEINILSRR
jgi:hypothetical protein